VEIHGDHPHLEAVEGSPIAGERRATMSRDQPTDDKRIDAIGLSIDMLDVDRMRHWSEKITAHGADISHWTSVAYAANWLNGFADRLAQAVRDIGVLRSVGKLPLRFAGRVGAGSIPYFNYDGEEPEYDQGLAVIVWFDDLYDLALARDSAEQQLREEAAALLPLRETREDETRLREFCGWLSADIPELHSVEVPRLGESLDRFLDVTREDGAASRDKDRGPQLDKKATPSDQGAPESAQESSSKVVTGETPEGWQPLSTAPKDGTVFVGLTIRGKIHGVRWDGARHRGSWWFAPSVATVYRDDELRGWIPCPSIPPSPQEERP
jgi:hypothetical protein